MSKASVNLWGFESASRSVGDRFGLLQLTVNTPHNPPPVQSLTSLAGLATSLTQTPTVTVSFGMGSSGYSITISQHVASESQQGAQGTGLFGSSPLQAAPTAQPTKVEVPQAFAAAAGNIQLNHDLLAGLVSLFKQTPAENTQQAQTGGQATASTATPPTTQTTNHQSAQPSQGQPASPTQNNAPTAQNPVAGTSTPIATTRDVNKLTINQPREAKAVDINVGFAKLPAAERQKVLSELRSTVERQLFSQFKANNKQSQDGLRTTINSLLTKLQSGDLPQANDKTLSGVAQKAVELMRQIAEPMVQKTLQTLKKDSFVADNRVEAYKQFFGTTPRSNLANPTMSRTFTNSMPSGTQSYPQASTQTYTNGSQQTSSSQPQLAQNSNQQNQTATSQPAHTAATNLQGNPLAPQFSAAALTTQHNDPYASPFQLGQPQAANDNHLQGAQDSRQAFGDARDGSGQQQGQRNPHQNGVNIDNLLTADGVLKPLTAQEAIQTIKFFYRRSGSTHLLDIMYDNQHLLNPTSGHFNGFLYYAATDQGFYNQHSRLSSGQVMQVLIHEVNQFESTPAQSAITLPKAPAANDIFAAHHAA